MSNRKELIETIMYEGGIVKDSPLGRELIKSLENNLPDFQRIDEERMIKILRVNSIEDAIKEYNSTLQPALKPLPKEMPKEYNSLATPYQVWLQVQQEYGTPANNLQPLPKEMPAWFNDIDVDNEDYMIWEKIIQHYGTPEPKPSLPSVEELAKEVYDWFRSVPSGDDYTVFIAQHLHDKYSLHPREWWQDCEKFIVGKVVKGSEGYRVFKDGSAYLVADGIAYNVIQCTPYTPLSAQDIIKKHNLSDEEVRAIREGK